MSDEASRRAQARAEFEEEYRKDSSRPSLELFVWRILPSNRGLTIGAVRITLRRTKAGDGGVAARPLTSP